MKVTRPQRWFQCTRIGFIIQESFCNRFRRHSESNVEVRFARLTKVDSMDPEALFSLAVFLVTAVRCERDGN